MKTEVQVTGILLELIIDGTRVVVDQTELPEPKAPKKKKAVLGAKTNGRDLGREFPDKETPPTAQQVYDCYPCVAKQNAALAKLKRLGITNAVAARMVNADPIYRANHMPVSPGSLGNAYQANKVPPLGAGAPNLNWYASRGWVFPGVHAANRGEALAEALERVVATVHPAVPEIRDVSDSTINPEPEQGT